MITVACVLRSGGDFTAEHVRQLQAGVAKHLRRVPYRFVCLSDIMVPGVETIRLVHDWPGWWSKLEMFRPGLFTTPVLYFDLDTRIVGDLSAIAASRPWALITLSDFFYPELSASGMMAWPAPWIDDAASDRDLGPEPRHFYEQFLGNEVRVMSRLGGDQDWIREQCGDWVTPRWQTLYPGRVVSWKVHCEGGLIPPDARVVCFHGQPRPWEVNPASAVGLK